MLDDARDTHIFLCYVKNRGTYHADAERVILQINKKWPYTVNDKVVSLNTLNGEVDQHVGRTMLDNADVILRKTTP